jgi:uncharacterized protein involved in exopolysaccharide biosynthesis/Mrp family chromosome partitioning ATPase
MSTLAPAVPVHRSAKTDEADLAGFFAILRQRWLSIVAFALAGVVLGVWYLEITPATYTASTTVFIEPRSRRIVADDVVQGGLGADAALIESQVAIIGSDAVLRRVVEKLELDKDPAFTPPPSEGGLLSRLKALVVKRPEPQDPKSRAIASLAGGLKVKRAQRTYVLEIEYSSSSALTAARIADEVAAAYIADQAASKAAEAGRANALIEARLDELREQVRRADTRVDEFKKANKILNSEGGVVSEQQLGRLNGELTTARAVAAEAKARFEQASAASAAGGNPEALPDAIRSSLIQRLREQHAQVARREAALSSQFQPRHPVVVEIRSQIAEIRNQIAAELKRIAQGANAEMQIALNREREVVRTLEQAKEEVARGNTAYIQLRELEGEANASRELLRQFLARSKETDAQQTMTPPDARVISPAAVPVKPARPIPWLVLGVGLFAGLGLGVARALVGDHLDSSVRGGSDASRDTGLPLIATIPALAGVGARLRALRGGAGAAGKAAYSDLLAALARPDDKASRDYRQSVLRLLSRIRSNEVTGRAETVLVVAPSTGSGGSATALALAYTAALQGERVLLVDAASQDAALSDVFARDLRQDRVVVLDNRDHLASIIVRDGRSGLHFLPIALADLRALKKSQRSRLVTGLTSLARGYDLVVIDGGPLLEDATATSLLPGVDLVLLVAGAGVTTRAAVVETADVLAPARDRVAGVVLTMSSSHAF